MKQLPITPALQKLIEQSTESNRMYRDLETEHLRNPNDMGLVDRLNRAWVALKLAELSASKALLAAALKLDVKG